MTKSAEAFRTISEVAEALGTPAHVLRFWESRFTQIRPVKRAGGRRYYRPADVALLGGIKRLLHEDGMTIRGVQKILREQGVRHVAHLSGLSADLDLPPPDEAPDAPRMAPAAVKAPWPGSPSPEIALPTDRLAADPEDAGDTDDIGDAEEAPFLLDAPLLPAGGSGPPLPLFPDARPAATATELPALITPIPGNQPDANPPSPAAAMLRAMDAVRAREKHGELRSVYVRLTRLHDRLARETGRPPGAGQD